MSDNLNDIVPDTDVQKKNDELNKILDSVDSSLQNKTDISKWQDELNTAIEKRSHKEKTLESCEEILGELERISRSDADAVVSAVLNEGNPPDDVQELIEQLTVAKKVSKLSSQKKKPVAEEITVEEILNIPQSVETENTTAEISEPSEEIKSENITENNAI